MKVKTGDVNDTDNYLWVKSKAKALKENSMNGLLSQRFEEGLQSIQEGIQKKGEDPGKKAGIYFLRTTLNIEDEKVFWSIYNTIREIEYTFRVLKTDLDLRPVFHKTDDASMAHLNLGLLAYWLVSTIRYQLKQKGYNAQWREIVRTMNTQKCITTTMENIDNEMISIRQCTEPNQKVKDIYKMMKFKPVPFYRKKSVDLPTEIFKNDSS